MQPGQTAAIQGGRLIMSGGGPRQAPTPALVAPAQPQPQPPPPPQPQPNEDTVIVRNSDGRYVQMPRTILKKLINSGQLKQQQQQQQSANSGTTAATSSSST